MVKRCRMIFVATVIDRLFNSDSYFCQRPINLIRRSKNMRLHKLPLFQ